MVETTVRKGHHNQTMESLAPYINPKLDALHHRARKTKSGLPTHYRTHPHYVAGCPQCLIISKNWNSANKEIHKVHCREYYRRLKEKVHSMLGGKCVVCGITDSRILTINHKNGDGAYYRKKHGGHLVPKRIYLDVLKGRIDIRTLDLRCHNHNILYEYETGRRHW